jgi:N-acetylmuramoyl-L-alanine amidase
MRSINRPTTGASNQPAVGQTPAHPDRCPPRYLCSAFRTGIFPFLIVFLLTAAPSERRLTVYSTAANYSLSIVQRQGHDYVGLLELLEPLGTVNAKLDGSRWRLRYDNILGEFVNGKNRARIQGRDTDLLGKFMLENGRGLVPVASLSSLLPRFLGGPVNLHEAAGRLFIGSVATHFTASVPSEDASHLVLHFSTPVNPSVASEPGKLRLMFNHEPITAPASPTLTFASKTIPSATYSEANGAAEIAVATTIPLMATFSSDGRTITLAPAKSQAAAGSMPGISPSPGANAQPSPVASPSAPTPPRRYFAVIDASHGGADRGEALSPTLAEKDVTLAIARDLRQALESRGITTLAIRDSDANIALDDRAFFTNSTHAAVYIAIHAASSGHGVRIYTAMLPYAETEDRGPFHPWATAQLASIPVSQTLAGAASDALRRIQVPVRVLTAPIRPLNNIVTAAIAVEVAPSASDISSLASTDYQELIAGAVANGVVSVRAQLGALP